MNILIFNTLYYPNSVGGAEKSVQLLAEELVKSGHVVSTVSVSQNIKAPTLHNGVKCYYFKFRNIYWPFKDNKNKSQKILWHLLDSTIYNQNLKRIINSVNPDLIHTNNLRMLSTKVWDIAHEKHIPVVHTFRDYSLICVNGKRYNNTANCSHTCFSCKIYKNLRSPSVEKVELFTGISDYITNIHSNVLGIKSDKFVTIYNPVLTNESEKDSVDESNDRTSIKIGFLGRVDNYKGIDYMLNEIKQVKNKKIEIFVAGEGDKDFVNNLLLKYKTLNINYLGYVEKSVIFNRIDYLVVPSLWAEPFGRTVIESYSYGVPVIVADNGGLPELVNNKTGIIFKPQNGNLTKIVQLLDKISYKNHVFKKTNLINEAKKYDVSNISKQYEAYYQLLLE